MLSVVCAAATLAADRLGMAQGGLSVAERGLRGRNAGRRLRLGMAQCGLSVAERRLRSRDAGRRLRLGIRQVGLVIGQRRLRDSDAGSQTGSVSWPDSSGHW